MSGSVQMTAIIFINSEIHVPRESGSKEPYWTRPITHAELATVCRCTVRAVEIKLKDLMDRAVVEGKRTASGFRYHIPFEKWAELPDMETVVEMEPEAAATDESVEDLQKKANRVHLYEKPQMLGAGKRSKPIEMAGLAPDKCSVKTSIGLTYNVELNNGTVIFHVLDGEQKEKREDKAKPNRNSGRFAPPEVVEKEHKSLSNFHLYESVWLENAINAAPDDWSASRVIWSQMEIAEQLAAVAGVKERFYLGEYDLKETKWIPLPQNYLQKKLWMRPIRGKQKEKAKVFTDQAGTDALMDWAREKDRARKAAKK